MGSLFGDLRYAIRSLARERTFTLVAVLTLVLGIGANTAIFSVIKAVLLNPLPYRDSSRLVVLSERNPNGNPDLVAPLTYLDWKEQSKIVAAMGAFRYVRYAFTGRGDPIDVAAIRLTPSLMQLLGVGALHGRTFVAAEGEFGRDRVAILSRSFWEKRFSASPEIIGRKILLDSQPYEVVGIMPSGFDFPPSGHVDVWTPLSFDPGDGHGRSRRARSLNVIGRLGDGTSLESAQREMSVIAARLATTYPDSNAGWDARLVAAQEQLVTTVRPALFLIATAVGFLLLMVSANLANLFLARLAGRRTEIAVRAALGAGRFQLVRQALAESFVLAITGGALGFLVAWAGVRFVHALPEGSLPRMGDVRVDAGVMLFGFLLSVAVALLFGLLPAIHASRAGLRDTVTAFSGTPSRSRNRLLNALVVAEVALALVLLVGAGLMTRSFARLMRVSPGFEPRNLMAVQIYLPPTKYRDGVQRTRFYKEAMRQIAGIPGVQSVAGVSALPMYPVGIDFALPFSVDGQAPPANGEEPRADIRTATPGYFDTMKIPLLRGRAIEERDVAGRPGAWVINETMARRYFGGQDPLGKVVKNAHGRGEVVGIAADVKHYGLDADPRAEVFLPAWQQPLPGMSLIVRTAADPKPFLDPIRRTILAVDAEQPIFDSSTMIDVVSRSVFLPRVSMLLLSLFATLALLLAIVGIYGVVSHTVSRRTREIGVRIALGAGAADTLRLVIGRSMLLVGGGAVFGLAASVFMTRAMTGLLYNVSPLDPIVFGSVALILAAAGLVASLIPARRATRVDPIAALRVD